MPFAKRGDDRREQVNFANGYAVKPDDRFLTVVLNRYLAQQLFSKAGPITPRPHPPPKQPGGEKGKSEEVEGVQEHRVSVLDKLRR